MRIHILGICGTFMAGIATLAQQLGHEISGSDEHVYPPMSTQLTAIGITLQEGYSAKHLTPHPDLVIVGNALSRGNPAVEYMLNEKIPFTSGPEWLAQHILSHHQVLAVAGTHGKTTTTSLLAWILECAGLAPNFLIGGVPSNFGISARYQPESSFFVIEADEYDTAFFDKRSKFLHYHPDVLILNNLEFDHADIFTDLAAIQRQVHYLIRTVPGNGHIVHWADDANILATLQQGCWTPLTTFGSHTADWQARDISQGGAQFKVYHHNQCVGEVNWALWGQHNVHNALAALAAASQVGVAVKTAIAALETFKSVARRMEQKAHIQGIRIFDDFGHHPTAIATTLAGLRAREKQTKIVVLMELKSYTMRTGHHQNTLMASLINADMALIQRPAELNWDLDAMLAGAVIPTQAYADIDTLVAEAVKQLNQGDCLVVFSNGGFDGIHHKLQTALKVKYS